jgi:DNA polymerase
VRELVGDFETASAVDLKEVGAWRYSEDITTEILCFSYVIAGVIKTWRPGDDISELAELASDPEVIFIAHNAGFEKAIWRNIMVALYGLPDVPNSRWRDTLASCAMRALPLDLDRAVINLRLPHHKDVVGSAFTKKMSKPNRKGYYDRSEASLQRVITYCEQDIRAELALWERIGCLPPGEHNVWLLDQRINERGLMLDLPFVKKAQEVVDRYCPVLVEEFKEITGGLKPTQTAKFKAWINDQGVWIDSLAKDVVAALLGEENEDDDADTSDIDLSMVVLPDNVMRALRIRSLVGSASIKKLKRMRACVGSDDRARGLLQYHGAGPGRWAGRLLQPHNFPRGTIKASDGGKFSPEYVVSTIMSGDPDIVALALGAPVESIVSSLRHAIIADTARGCTLLSGDFAGIEARIVLALAGQNDKTALMASGADVYIDMACTIDPTLPRPTTKAEIKAFKEMYAEMRQNGKNSVLGLGFQMGWRKFKMKYGGNLTDDECKRIVDIYRKTWAPKVPKAWEKMGDAALGCVKTGKAHEAYGTLYQLEDRWLTALLPSGRKLWYFNPQLTQRAVPWDETDVRMAFTYQQMKTGQWKTIDAFGGLLTENVVQALARDLMVEAMFKLEKNGFPIILTVHDEIVCEPLKENADEKAFQEIMCDIPAWAKKIQVPVAVETWQGDRYRK